MFIRDPYLSFVSKFARLAAQSLPLPEPKAEPLPDSFIPKRLSQKPCALLFTPHPDDECLTGALPLRLHQEADWQIINVAVTLGSKVERRAARWAELAQACKVLDFDVMQAVPGGFSTVRRELRDTQLKIWEKMAQRLAEIITRYEPQAVFLPHAHDEHYTHIGTHLLVMDALTQMPKEFACPIVQTEWWQPLEAPNLLIGITKNDSARLLKALSCHAGEVSRNPYHMRFPAYLIDSVRRGSERVGGAGAPGVAMDFAMLYRVDRWENGRLLAKPTTTLVGSSDDMSSVF